MSKKKWHACLKFLKEDITHLHLAGDISNHYFQDSLPFLSYLSNHLKLTYNLGNHDMLDLKEDQIEALDFKTYRLSPSTSLLAFHAWYDYSFSPDKTESEILAFKKRFWFDRRLQRPLTDPQLSQSICQTLDHTLTELQGQKIIVAMHFVPHSHFLLKSPKFIPFNAYLGSQAFHDIFLKHQVDQVIFGHNHHRIESQVIDTITYHSRPLGYIKEWQLSYDFMKNYSREFTLPQKNLNKAYTAIKDLDAFKAYKKSI
ncbi:metallophosphoesterase [Streptococcus didelphis]|uniref:metallophosphoesterase n=1 Tax=Streptococcus didelphis TaxID=102886 RepID=UPI0027D2A2A7|nr:metallophosphoesterase [Streptococcus didelphis]